MPVCRPSCTAQERLVSHGIDLFFHVLMNFWGYFNQTKCNAGKLRLNCNYWKLSFHMIARNMVWGSDGKTFLTACQKN